MVQEGKFKVVYTSLPFVELTRAVALIGQDHARRLLTLTMELFPSTP